MKIVKLVTNIMKMMVNMPMKIPMKRMKIIIKNDGEEDLLPISQKTALPRLTSCFTAPLGQHRLFL